MKYIYSILCILLLAGCGHRNHHRRLVERMMAATIALPEETLRYGDGADRFDPASPAKMVVYFDSEVCATCELSRIWEWNEFAGIAETSEGRFQMLFVFAPRPDDLKAVKKALRMVEGQNKLIFIDERQQFAAANPAIPEEGIFHTFLLDGDNRVVLVGNPVYNETLQELYKTTIRQLLANDGRLPDMTE